jgi:hypothetical protein
MAGDAMSQMWGSIVLALAGFGVIGVGFATEPPCWVMVSISLLTGGNVVFAFADYRDEIRRRDGLLQRDMGWKKG